MHDAIRACWAQTHMQIDMNSRALQYAIKLVQQQAARAACKQHHLDEAVSTS